MRRRRLLLGLMVLAVLAGACSDSGDGGSVGQVQGQGQGSDTTAGGGDGGTGSSAPATPAAPPKLADVRARLVKVADIDQPVALAVRPNDDALYVAEKSGRVVVVAKGQTTSPGDVGGTAVLDIASQVSTGGEQGLLGLTFSPDGNRLYVNYTDRAGDTRVVEYAFRDGRADTGTRRELLFVDQPFANHNGGEVVFGPDGKLYIGLGDGGSQRDPNNRGQNLGDLLGKLLRIDPAPSGGTPYTVPSDNPFVNRSGARPEVWMYGLRNPWRFTWDRQTGDLWIADVGQNRLEEIDFLAGAQPAGSNFGWSLMEGTDELKGPNPAGALLPIFEYSHDEGCSVTGGYVYRGQRVPSLRGVYLYGDACSGTLWGLVQADGKVADQGALDLPGLSAATGGSGYSIASFGEDGGGELYLLSLGGGLFRFEAA